MVTGEKETGIIYEEDLYKEDDCPLIGEEIFWSEDDPRWGDNGNEGTHGHGHVVDLSKKSWIYCCTGGRGMGKSSYMTYIVIKSALLYSKRIISNLPIKVKIRYQNGDIKLIESEPLDIAKLLKFDDDYKGCILVLDEAPRVINRLSTMTWKNRLFNLWVQQIRHSEQSLFYASQEFRLIDGELRWQTDIIAECMDAKILWPEADYEEGAIILADLYDHSGQWTGYSYEKRPRKIKRKRIITELIWGTFDTYHESDVFESLKRVNLNVGEYQIGEEENESDYVKRGVALSLAIEGGEYSSIELFEQVGEGTDAEKQKLGSLWRMCGVKTSPNGKKKDFAGFDKDKFERLTGKYMQKSGEAPRF